jgi:hypothetical protein
LVCLSVKIFPISAGFVFAYFFVDGTADKTEPGLFVQLGSLTPSIVCQIEVVNIATLDTKLIIRVEAFCVFNCLMEGCFDYSNNF